MLSVPKTSPLYFTSSSEENEINLDLVIGSCATISSTNEKEEDLRKIKRMKFLAEQEQHKESTLIFTSSQLNEFYSQILVFKFIDSGLPVPFQLYLPIWFSSNFSDSSSFGTTSDISSTCPTRSSWNNSNMTIITTMDHLEPGRCRRTDGRKWRCKKNVVPHQKYCERHMHRGCPSSRKNVEKNSDHVPPLMLQFNLGDGKYDLHHHDDALPTDLTSIGGTSRGRSCGDVEGNYKDITCSEIAISRKMCSSNDHVCSSNDHVVGNDDHKGFLVLSPGFGSSSSLLNEREGNLNQDFGCKNSFMRTGPQSCRRTDGKKWQCKKIVLPDKKYCEAHMYRGAKSKGLLDQESLRRANMTTDSSSSSRGVTKSCNDGGIIDLNAMPPASLKEDEGNSDSCFNRLIDATTIADENISNCVARSVCFV